MPSYYFDPTATAGSGVGTLANPYFRQSQVLSMPQADNTILYFARGTTWRPTDSETGGNPNTFLLPFWLLNRSGCGIDAYGFGNEPIIDGSIDLTSWTTESAGIYSKSMTNTAANFGYTNPGNLTQGSNVPTYIRWRGTLNDSLAATAATRVQTYDYNTDKWYLKSPDDPASVTVQASYWQHICHSINGVKRTGNIIKNIKVQRFSSYPFVVAGLDGLVVDNLRAWSIGGHYRKTQSFHEGNVIDVRAGCDNAIFQNCYFEDVFDAGIAPQFGDNWDAWNSLSNVTIKDSFFYRHGLAGVETVIQSQNNCLIDGVYVENNYFEDCGRGPFQDTNNGFHGAVTIGQNGLGGTSLSTNMHIRYNRMVNCSIFGGDVKGPAIVNVYGNIAKLNSGQSLDGSTENLAVSSKWSVNNGGIPGSLQLRCFGNVISGFPNGIGINGTNNFPFQIIARYNTIVDGTIAFRGNNQQYVTAAISNTTVTNTPTLANGFSGFASSITSNGGLYLSGVSTNGMTLDTTDVTGSAPSFVNTTDYKPIEGSIIYSGGPTSFPLHSDPAEVLFTSYPSSRNAYAVFTAGTIEEPPPEEIPLNRIVQSKLLKIGTFASKVGATGTISFDDDVSAGNTVVVCLAGWNSSETGSVFDAPTDNQTNTYTVVNEIESGASSHFFAAMYQSDNVSASGTFTITINFDLGSDNVCTAVILELAGTTIDKNNTGSSSLDATSTAIGSTGVLSSQPQIIVALLSHPSENVITVDTPTGYEIRGQDYDDAGITVATKVVTATTAEVLTWTHGGVTQGSSGVIATFLTSAGASSSSRPPVLRKRRNR